MIPACCNFLVAVKFTFKFMVNYISHFYLIFQAHLSRKCHLYCVQRNAVRKYWKETQINDIGMDAFVPEYFIYQ